MTLVSLQDVRIRFRGPPLLDGINGRIAAGERIGLLGRNGSGKTTLMRLIGGELEPDTGSIERSPGAVIRLLPQDVPQDIGGTVRSIVAGGLDGGDLALESWQRDRHVNEFLSRMELQGETPFAELSSGRKRRVLLARALVARPDLLLLDEPTNHLDVESIEWLERFLDRWTGALLFVTHDRMFLQRLAHRIWELDRGHLFDWACSYDTFLKRKEQALEAEAKQNALFDKRLAQEEAWIRRGILARRTRNEGRVRALQEMRRRRRERRDRLGRVKMELVQELRSGQLVVEAEQASFAYGDQPVIRDFSTLILRGDKIGIIGPNGAGKTTLLKLLLGQLQPTSGHVRLGTNLQIAYFDQLRQQLDPDATVLENVGEGADTIRVGGRTRHLIGYLQDFLFTPERARLPVRFLSGGERHRILLARLFARPANVVVLDEPTNDLDTETLELLEERLVEFPGTVLLVSHDRAFLNHVVTNTLVFEEGLIREYAGGYDDWQRQRAPTGAQNSQKSREAEQGKSSAGSTPPQRARQRKPQRLTYREQQELAALPDRIERLESEIRLMHEAMANEDFYRQDGTVIARAMEQLRQSEQQLQDAYARWEELEERSD